MLADHTLPVFLCTCFLFQLTVEQKTTRIIYKSVGDC